MKDNDQIRGQGTAKVFINVVLRQKGYSILFAGLIGVIAAVNMFLYIHFRIRLARGGYSQVQADVMSKNLTVIALCSSVIIIFLIIMYLQFKNTRLVIGSGGIAYLSLLKNIRTKWKNVEEISILERSNTKILSFKSKVGTFCVGPQYVDSDERPLPDIRFEKNGLVIRDKEGNLKPYTLEESGLYRFLKQVAPKGLIK